MAQELKTEQRIGLHLSQQQLRFVKLLEMNAPELDEAVERELEDNPALGVKEETTEEERERYSFYRPAREDVPQFSPADESESLYDNLYSQLSERDLDSRVEAGARYIIGNLDSNGYLTRSLREVTDDMAFGSGIDLTDDEAREALATVKSLDPPGIGAANLQECLEMQLTVFPPSEERDDALRIIREGYEYFILKHKHRLVTQLKLSAARVDAALDLILSLNPKPGAALGNDSSRASNVIIPDFIVDIEDGNISISLNNNIPELQIEESFEQAMSSLERTKKGRPKKGSEFIVGRFNDARDFIKVLSQRQQTMMNVMTAIVKIQKEYFLTEDIYNMRPMMIKNVSEETGLDLSVISRATTNKFVALPWGIFPLRFFFSDSIGDEGDDSGALTNRKVEAEISTLVNGEDKRHPLSDRKIMEVMMKRGFEVSRRTVAKYRDRLGIPVARLRKEL